MDGAIRLPSIQRLIRAEACFTGGLIRVSVLMKKIVVRLGILAIYVLAALLNLTILPPGYDFWSCGLAAAFAVAVVLFTGRASLFVLVPVFIVTCVIPIAALTAMVRPAHDSWAGSVSHLISEMAISNPLHGLELVLPLATAAISLILTFRWLRPGDSPSPNPHQGGA